MPYEDYIPVSGIILSVIRGGDCCSQMLSMQTDNGIVNFMVDSRTKVIEDAQLRSGMRVVAFYDGREPVPLIFPPRYRARLITAAGRNEQVSLNRFDRNLVAMDGSLQLNISGNTVVRTANGQNFHCNLSGQVLLVYYTATTRSIPPQTTPSKVIVFCRS